MQLMAAIFYPFVGLINQAETPSHSQANKLYGNPRKVLKFTYCEAATPRYQKNKLILAELGMHISSQSSFCIQTLTRTITFLSK